MIPAQVHLQQVQEGAAATRIVGPTVFEDMQARMLEVERENARLREEVRQREITELTERLRLAELVYIYIYIYMTMSVCLCE